jgi:hypothetical protein
MENIIITPTSSSEEKNFFLMLLKKMQKKTVTVPAIKLEDFAFLKAMKETEKRGKGDIKKVKEHLLKVASGK